MSINDLDDVLRGDDVALSLVRDASSGFQTAKEKKHLRTLREESKRLAEDFLNAYLARELDKDGVEAALRDLSNIRVERPLSGASKELLEIYKHLELIRDYGTRTVALDYPQSLADPLLLRAYPPEIIQAEGARRGADVGALVELIKQAHRAMGLPNDNLAPNIASRYTELSVPLLLNYMDIRATKVYFMGPVFYGNAGQGWTVTFSTGSGLPDPLEWNGALWFMGRYDVTAQDLERHGLKVDKNPFRALNFSVGITNRNWACRRLYVWQRSKTSQQARAAYALAKEAGKAEVYVRDAIAQLLQVFETPNLLILELEDFPTPLTMWTRISEKDVMLSCRPGTPESKIANGIWLRPGLRIGSRAVRAIKETAAGLAGVGTGVLTGVIGGPALPAILTVLAQVSASLLLGRAISEDEEKHRQEILELQEKTSRAFDAIWRSQNLPGFVKRPRPYFGQEALEASARVLASLLGLPQAEVLAAYAG